MKRFFILCTVSVISLHGWSLTDSISDAATNVSSWFSKQQTQTSSKEYAITLTSPINISTNGSVAVTTWNKPAIMVEATKKGSEEAIKTSKFNVTIKNDDEKSVVIGAEQQSRDAQRATIDYVMIVPRTAPLTIRTESGNIRVQEHKADLDAQTLDGTITLEQTTKNVKAKAPRGSITAEQHELKDDASIFLEAERDITLVMPEDANANISAHTTNGKISSEIFITLDPMTTRLNKEAYKRMQQHVRGTTGAGGVPITLESIKGNITIIGN